MKTLGYAVLAVVVLVAGFYAFNNYIYTEKQGELATDYKDATYVFSGKQVTLKDGVYEEPAAPGAASKTVTRYFGNEVMADLDGDGDQDVAFLLTREEGGSGTFYYLAGAIKEVSGYRGTSAMLIGDRIAPQTTEYRDGKVIVNYADRRPGEPFTTPPSVGKSLYAKYDAVSQSFGEVVQDFEGEADPSKMTLDMKTWAWISTAYTSGTSTVPLKAGKFTLTFTKTGTFSLTTDCNGVGGEYVATKTALTFSKMVSTKMYCEGSQEGEFTSYLTKTKTYRFTSKGELVIEFTGGSVTLR